MIKVHLVRSKVVLWPCASLPPIPASCIPTPFFQIRMIAAFCIGRHLFFTKMRNIMDIAKVAFCRFAFTAILNAPYFRLGMMQTNVLPYLHHLKIFKAIICSISILVMDVCSIWNRPVSGSPHQTMLSNPHSLEIDSHVSIAYVSKGFHNTSISCNAGVIKSLSLGTPA